jgi:hypothetical protein
VDMFKQHIVGFHGGRVNGPSPRAHAPGQTCPCCREVDDKQVSRRLARKRLRAQDRRAGRDKDGAR